MRVIILVLVALKIAGVGQFSWWIPIGLLVLYTIVNIIVRDSCEDRIGDDWHDGMFE